MNYKLSVYALILWLFLPFYLIYAENDSLHIEVYAPQLKTHPISLCSYFDGKIYKQDSLLLSEKGEGSFYHKERLPEGLYLILIDNARYFDLLLADDQSLSITIDTLDFIGKTQITGAEQSEAFLAYARYIQEKRKEQEKIISLHQKQTEEKQDKQVKQTELNKLNEEVFRYQKAFASRYKEKWVGLFFHGLDPVQTGPYPTPQNGEEALQEFQYQKYHFFDNMDLQDARFWRTNYFPEKIITYMNQQVEQIPDSLANAASNLTARTEGDSVCFRLMISKLTNYSASNLLMGMENVWAKLAEDYYFKDAVNWADSTHLASIQSEYKKIRYNRIGMTAYNMDLEDAVGNPVKLYDTGKRYTLVYFYEPTCGHCKKTTPLIHEVYQKYADKGLDVACIYTLIDKKEWLNFVNELGLEGKYWHNLWDPDRKSYYWQYYNTSSTPALYVLDENKKIIAKKLDPETLDKLFNALFENIK